VNASDKDPRLIKDPLIGQALGKCQITDLIGEGRTSVVYKASYRPLKRTVAVKVLQPEMTKYPAVVRVFQQEGRAVAALDHENVVKIYDVGEDKGVHYLVLELLRGKTVLRCIEESDNLRLPVGEALEYARQTAAGLAAAHRKKLIHRDIKPQNLVIEPDGTLKIVDFGLAAEAEGAFAGGRLGTPHYMSPEVCRGELAETASDVYALGITLFHMLVGHPPFAGRKTTEEIIAGHLAGERLFPEKLKNDIPRPVGDLVRRMTRMDPSARPGAKEVADYIAEKLTPEKLGARHRVRSARRGVARRRSQSQANLYLGLGAVIVIGLIVLLLAGRKGDEEDTGGAAQTENVPPPPPVEQKPEEKPDKPVEIEDKTLEQALKDLLADGKREEKTGNLTEALLLYQRVLVKAPPNSRYAVEAKAAAELVKGRLEAERGEKEGIQRKYISISASEKAGQEFVEKQPEFWRRLTDFEVSSVKQEAEALRDRTREGSAERAAIELALDRMRYVESLLGIIGSRAAALSEEKASWSQYDMDEERDFLITGAGEKGINLRDEETGANEVKPWSAVSARQRILFLDALRNPSSATETLWLAAYCKLLGQDGAMERYCDYALMLDQSPEFRAQVTALRGK